MNMTMLNGIIIRLRKRIVDTYVREYGDPWRHLKKELGDMDSYETMCNVNYENASWIHKFIEYEGQRF